MMFKIDKTDMFRVSEWHELRPAEPSAGPARLLPVPGQPYPGPLLNMHNDRKTVERIGCHFVADCQLNIGGLLTRDGVLLREGSILTDHCERYYLDDQVRRNNPLHAPETIVIDGPALCLYSAGVKVFGHWLMEFIPRAALARAVMGERFHQAIIPLPREAPGFVEEMLEVFVGASRARVLRFDPEQHSLTLREAWIPSYVHTRYHLHSFFKEVFAPFQPPAVPDRKLWVVRADFTRVSAGEQRILLNQDALLEIARDQGYEIIDPATLSLVEQAHAFRRARVVVGDFGSALHNTIHCLQDCRIITIRAQNSIQSRIAARYDHAISYILPDDEVVDGRRRTYTVSPDLIRTVLAEAG